MHEQMCWKIARAMMHPAWAYMHKADDTRNAKTHMHCRINMHAIVHMHQYANLVMPAIMHMHIAQNKLPMPLRTCLHAQPYFPVMQSICNIE